MKAGSVIEPFPVGLDDPVRHLVERDPIPIFLEPYRPTNDV
jgi:hypothetical protein